MKAKSASYNDVSTISMVAGKEKKIRRVVHGGHLKEWVAFGWITLRPATKADIRRYPSVK